MVESLASLCAIALVLSVVDGKPTTTSLDIARHFGRRHDNVMDTIRALIAQLPADHLLNFQETVIQRANPSGGEPIDSPAYRITRDGFTLLAMGFTGKKALQFKLAYIDAFNRMEAELSKPTRPMLTMKEQPDQERIAMAMAAANEIAGKVQAAIFAQLMASGKSWQHERYMLSFNYSHEGAVPCARMIERDAMVMSVERLAKAIKTPGETMISNAELASLASACNQRLAQRPGVLGQMLMQSGPDAPFTADEVANIVWHATWRMHREATDLKRAGHLEQLRKQVQALPPHELADIAAEAWLNLAVTHPAPKHLESGASA